MNWRDDPRTPPYWITFADLLVAAHPEWEPFILGPLDGHGIYDVGDERFFIEIPSVHPTILEPLTVEMADRKSGGLIDTYWNGTFEHNFCGSDKSRWREQIASVVEQVESWTSDEWTFRQFIESRGGRRVESSIHYADGTRVSTDEMPFVQ